MSLEKIWKSGNYNKGRFCQYFERCKHSHKNCNCSKWFKNKKKYL